MFRKAGYSMEDIVNYYYYVLITEAMAKVDAAAKKSAELIQILETERSTRPEDVEARLAGTPQSLATIVHSQAKRGKDITVDHPVQHVVRAAGLRILSLLNMFDGSSLDLSSIISSEAVTNLSFTLDKKAAYTMDSDPILGDRRTLQRALRLIKKSLQSASSRTVSFTGSIEGVTHM